MRDKKPSSTQRIDVLRQRTFNLLDNYKDDQTKTHQRSKTQEGFMTPEDLKPLPLPQVALSPSLVFPNMSGTRKRKHRYIPSCPKEKQLSTFLDESRLLTLIRFNYRVSQRLKELEYGRVFDSLIKTKTRKNDFDFKEKNINCKGSMNIVELWSDRSMLEVLGETQLPKNRYKVLKGILRRGDVKV